MSLFGFYTLGKTNLSNDKKELGQVYNDFHWISFEGYQLAEPLAIHKDTITLMVYVYMCACIYV